MRRPLLAALPLVLALAGAVEARTPTDEVRGFFASATAAINDPKVETPADRLVAVRGIVTAIVDFPVAAQQSLGPVWQARSAAEREEFVSLFGSMLTGSVVARFATIARTHGGLSVRYVGEHLSDGGATVHTTMIGGAGTETAVDYAMTRRGDRWLIRDVIIDGVSVIGNYRAQFSRILGSTSFSDLLSRLRARIGPSSAVAMEAPRPGLVDPSVAIERSRGATPAPATAETRPAARVEIAPITPAVPAVKVADTMPPTARPIDGRLLPDIRVAEPKPPDAKSTDAKPTGPRPAIVKPPVTLALAPVEPQAAEARPRQSAARPAPAALAPASRPYWIQVASLGTVTAAHRLEERLHRDLPAATTRLEPTSAPGGITLTRVRVGPYATRAEASRVVGKLQAKGYQPFIAE